MQVYTYVSNQKMFTFHQKIMAPALNTSLLHFIIQNSGLAVRSTSNPHRVSEGFNLVLSPSNRESGPNSTMLGEKDFIKVSLFRTRRVSNLVSQVLVTTEPRNPCCTKKFQRLWKVSVVIKKEDTRQVHTLTRTPQGMILYLWEV